LAYTRYCFVFGLLCTNQYHSLRTHPLFRHPTAPRHRPQYRTIYCFPPPPRYYNVHHTLLAVAISCKGGQPLSSVGARAGGAASPAGSLAPGMSPEQVIIQVSLHKILIYFKALVWESIILLLPPPTCNAYPIAILLHAQDRWRRACHPSRYLAFTRYCHHFTMYGVWFTRGSGGGRILRNGRAIVLQ